MKIATIIILLIIMIPLAGYIGLNLNLTNTASVDVPNPLFDKKVEPIVCPEVKVYEECPEPTLVDRLSVTYTPTQYNAVVGDLSVCVDNLGIVYNQRKKACQEQSSNELQVLKDQLLEAENKRQFWFESYMELKQQ